MNLVSDAEILLVEDDPVDAELILTALKTSCPGATINALPDGVEAIDYLFARGSFAHRSPESTPKVIFLDLKLPKVNGLEVLQRIRQDSRTRAIPVVMFSSSRELSDIQTCYRLGANSYVVKPVDAEHFIKTIAEMGNYWVHINEISHTVLLKFSE